MHTNEGNEDYTLKMNGGKFLPKWTAQAQHVGTLSTRIAPLRWFLVSARRLATQREPLTLNTRKINNCENHCISNLTFLCASYDKWLFPCCWWFHFFPVDSDYGIHMRDMYILWKHGSLKIHCKIQCSPNTYVTRCASHIATANKETSGRWQR